MVQDHALLQYSMVGRDVRGHSFVLVQRMKGGGALPVSPRLIDTNLRKDHFVCQVCVCK